MAIRTRKKYQFEFEIGASAYMYAQGIHSSTCVLLGNTYQCSNILKDRIKLNKNLMKNQK
jgi:hypothetical protein